MIDTHCHIDQYQNPIKLIQECEKLGITTIGMTNLPSHFEMGYQHVLPFKKTRLALGMHPLFAEQHEKEYNAFLKNSSRTSYIGEIGLDFSRAGLVTKEIQLQSLKKILKHLSGKNKFLSLHSRKAEKEVLELLIENNIKNAVFHWYSGPLKLIDEIINAGHFFSINPAMIRSKTGQAIVKKIPLNFILTESDGPFIEINGRPIVPQDISMVIQYFSSSRSIHYDDVEKLIDSNFRRIISLMK